MLPDFVTNDRLTLETTARQHCLTTPLLPHAILCRVLGKYIVFASADDIGLTPHLCLNGFWESWVTIALARTLEPGWFCVDVGANQGYFTLLMADAVGSDGRVLAIEPNPKLIERLEQSLEVNGFRSNVTIQTKAAADVDGRKLNLIVPLGRPMDATLFRQATRADELFEVETITVDKATCEWPRVDLIKIDAEGAEEVIWHGMERTLNQNHGITVIMEVRCSRYANPERFVREITAAGFILRHIDYDGTVQGVTADQILTERDEKDWMLFLCRK